jgi:GTP-binding protein
MGGYGALKTAPQMMRILNAEYIASVVEPKQKQSGDMAEICFIGRSNVGKSSLINKLVMRKVARTSSTPGATKTINLYRNQYEHEGLRKWAMFSDFPGFGYSKVAKSTYRSWESMIDRYIVENQSIKGLIWALDVRRDPDVLDTTVLQWIRFNRLPFCLVLTKCDKEGRSFGLRKKEQLRAQFETNNVFLFSAKDGYGREALLSQVVSTLEEDIHAIIKP